MQNHSYNVKIENLVRGRMTYMNNKLLHLCLIDNNNVNRFYFNTISEVRTFIKFNKLKLTQFVRDKLNEPYESDPNYKHPFQTYEFLVKHNFIQLNLFT